MAMYYQSSSDIHGDGLQTLYLMNPNYVPYSDTTQSQPHLNNMLFFNSAALMPPHAPPPHFPLPHDPSRHQDISAAAARHHYGTWGLVDQQAQQTLPPRGLSLSLSAHHQAGLSISGDRDFPASSPTESNVQSAIMGSKYLKIAQELLDEVVNVGNDRPEKAKTIKGSTAADREAQPAAAAAVAAADDLSTAQKHEIQMKKVKLNTMLDEVEQRCRQYQQQMQIIIGSFEQAAGAGSAKSYTQLALKTISKQFRCLKSTISAQIKGLNKSLGEEEDENNISRLKFVDQQVRQRRAMQQLGMVQSNAWRPQRGLPERAVSVLRAWLFQHFLHPYPKDSDKQMLAKQTGLTRSQVSNWFINARVRLWKPMVEEMYLEETKKQQLNNSDSTSIKPESTSDTSPPLPPASSASPVPPSRTNFAQLITSLNMDGSMPEKSPKKPRNADHERFSAESYLSMAAAANMNGSFGIEQQLATGNNFSLSLGLPPTQSFLSHRSFGMGEEVAVGGGGRISEGGPTIGYEILDFQNRKSFPPQLLPDFVT